MDQALLQGGQAELTPAFSKFMPVIMFVTLGILLVTVLVKIAFDCDFGRLLGETLTSSARFCLVTCRPPKGPVIDRRVF